MKISNSDKSNAVAELGQFLCETEQNLIADGWSWYGTSTAPESFADLQSHALNKIIPVANYGCDNSVYGSSELNMKMRFFHDITHVKSGLGFSCNEELKVVDLQLEVMKKAGLSSLAMKIFFYDFAGQAKYYERNRAFVIQQNAFVDSCLQNGIDEAIKIVQ